MANFITILRAILGFVAIAALYHHSVFNYVFAFILTILVIWMDGLDGYVARKFNESSKFGALLDILGDRIVENAYWIAFLSLGWLPVWVPLVVVSRGLITDSLRSVAFEQGYTAFGKSTMMQNPIGKFIVTSNFSRFSYAIFKAVAFALLIAANIPAEYKYKSYVSMAGYFAAYSSIFFCVVRGLPVIIESKRFIFNNESAK